MTENYSRQKLKMNGSFGVGNSNVEFSYGAAREGLGKKTKCVTNQF
jgi:hypothetical protein